ncbi:MAG: hypothetical protein RBS38_09745 [Bacteroidales bacterium]|jgi:hypothetical protein|nr:hypothetical protein [Bacteroidales bacterium]
MKNRNLKLVISIVLVIAASCNEPETIVTNIVHSDGSVTRRIEMKNLENKFELSDLQVPFDSTWTIRDSLEIEPDGDTIWVKRAEKRFASVDEINLTYQSDSGANREVSRHAEFRKKFRWFNTEYSFSEIIDKKMSYGYPVRNFLNEEELRWFYSPASLTDEKLNGADSLKFRALNDTVDKKIERWYLRNLVSEWIEEFTRLTGDAGEDRMSLESLKQREDEFAATIEKNSEHFDSLWAEGTLLREFIGDANAVRYKTEADSAAESATDRFLVNFKNYTLRTVMPGKLTETNGFSDSAGVLLWPVRSDFFLTEPYEMTAESKVTNKFAWIISGLFVIFTVIGVIIRKKGKG